MSDNIEQSSASSTKTQTMNVSIEENALSWKIFNAFVEGNEICVTKEELSDYITKELNADCSKLPSFYKENLHIIIIAFMNAWSGWLFKNDFLAGKFKKQHYFNRFQKYMAHKTKTLCNFNSATNVLKSLPASIRDKFENETSPTESYEAKKNSEFAPYAIAIQCPPHMLNTIVFSNIKDDVIMKQHLGNPWQDLSTAQLCNWPHVEVSFRSQDICFVRRQATDYVRYLNFLPHECKKTNDKVIEHAEILTTVGRTRSCYTYRFLEEYVKEYILALKTIKDITGSKLEEIQTILYQFLEDVRYINVNKSMVTNTVVLFKLSQVPFIRNKKLVKGQEQEGEDARVGYCEIVTPKVEVVLLYFKARQKDTPYISFEYTDEIKRGEAKNCLPYISYKCTFCRVEFTQGNTKQSMMEHLKKEHKMEQHVRCTMCKKQFDVLNLTACRWRHKCVTNNSSSVTVL